MSATKTRRDRQRQLAGPRERYLHGNLLVQQVKSAIGRNARQLDGLRSLKLGRIGRSAICDAENEATQGQLHELQFMLAVAPLTLDAASFAGALIDGGLAVEPDTRDGDWGCTTAHDGFVRASASAADGGTVAWSTALPLTTVVRRIAPMLPPPSDEDAKLVLRGGRIARVPYRSLLDHLQAASRDAVYGRVEFEGSSLLWERATYPGHVDHTFRPGRLRFVGPIAPDSFEELLALTATPEVAVEAALVRSSVSGVLAW